MKSLTQTIQSQCVIADNGPTYWCRAQEILSSWLWREKRNRSERSRSRSRSTLTYPTMADLLPHRNKNGGEKARGLPHHGMGRHGGQTRLSRRVVLGHAGNSAYEQSGGPARTHPSLLQSCVYRHAVPSDGSPVDRRLLSSHARGWAVREPLSAAAVGACHLPPLCWLRTIIDCKMSTRSQLLYSSAWTASLISLGLCVCHNRRLVTWVWMDDDGEDNK
jgi:hypothetical protein